MIGTPVLSAITPTQTLQGAEGLKQTAHAGIGKKKPLKGIKALAVTIKVKKIPLHKLHLPELKGKKL